ncbi:MAG: hypothetical protein LBI64_00925, partial [Coriobacteriales bacterium]|nr:hypothetical protein [Coriobacteriales bacterium]
MTLADRINQAVTYIQSSPHYLSDPPEIALVLGSGLGELASLIDLDVAYDYADIPHFKTSGAPGHPGRLLFGTLAGRRVACMQGRL